MMRSLEKIGAIGAGGFIVLAMVLLSANAGAPGAICFVLALVSMLVFAAGRMQGDAPASDPRQARSTVPPRAKSLNYEDSRRK
jgi:hypothetical protein